MPNSSEVELKVPSKKSSKQTFAPSNHQVLPQHFLGGKDVQQHLIIEQNRLSAKINQKIIEDSVINLTDMSYNSAFIDSPQISGRLGYKAQSNQNLELFENDSEYNIES